MLCRCRFTVPSAIASTAAIRALLRPRAACVRIPARARTAAAPRRRRGWRTLALEVENTCRSASVCRRDSWSPPRRWAASADHHQIAVTPSRSCIAWRKSVWCRRSRCGRPVRMVEVHRHRPRPGLDGELEAGPLVRLDRAAEHTGALAHRGRARRRDRGDDAGAVDPDRDLLRHRPVADREVVGPPVQERARRPSRTIRKSSTRAGPSNARSPSRRSMVRGGADSHFERSRNSVSSRLLSPAAPPQLGRQGAQLRADLAQRALRLFDGRRGRLGMRAGDGDVMAQRAVDGRRSRC